MNKQTILWNPYPETHPLKDGFYLVTIKKYDLNPDFEGEGICGDPKYLETFSLEVMEMAFEVKYEYNGDCGFYCDYGTEVIAWSEMPPPYKVKGA